MAGYLGTKAAFLSTTAASVTGNATIGGDLNVSGDVQADGVYNQSGDNDSGLDLSTNDVVAVKTGNTERMKIDADGYVTMPNQPAFIASNISGSTIGDNATVVYANVSTNRGSMYNTSNGRMTAVATGLYFVTAHLRIHTTSATTTYHRIMIAKNGTRLQYTRGRLTSRTSGNYSYVEVSAIVAMAKNDYIEVEFENGAGQSFNISGNDESAFSGYLIA